jgi:hypothetical protein
LLLIAAELVDLDLTASEINALANLADGQSSPFPELMGQVMTTAERFGHRQHVHLTWLAVRRYGTPPAVGLVSDGIQSVTRYAGARTAARAPHITRSSHFLG